MNKFLVVVIMLLNLNGAVGQTASLNRGLIAYYPFNENANDQAGINHGNISGARITTLRCDDYAYEFDGVNDFIDCGNDPSLNQNFYGFTISAWINPAYIGNNEFGTIVAKWGFDPSLDHFGLWINENYKIVAAVGDMNVMENGIFSNTMLQVGEWYHIVATWSRNRRMAIYINGTMETKGMQTGNGINMNSTVNLRLGQQEGRFKRPYKGLIDEVRLYGRSLSPAEVKALYDFDKSACEKIYIQGNVYDKKTGKPVSAEVIFENLTTGDQFKKIATKGSDCSYQLTLPIGYRLGMYAEAKEYLSITDNVDTRKMYTNQTIIRDLYVVPLQVGESLRMNNLFFDTGKSDLRSESFAELNRLLKLFDLFPKLKIEISGHTDSVGSDLDNQQLSEDRASAVRQYLLSRRIESENVIAKGFGEKVPVATNDTPDGRQQNRRVEFKILSK
ncbi:MAG: LamG-like jellyroll fold domain-containing protein [Cyclobacteriaceae bacterium]